MMKPKNNLTEILKFIIRLGLGLAVLLAVAVIVLPVGVIISDYYADTPFPLGFTVFSSILALVCLAIFVRTLRHIEIHPIKTNSERTKQNQEFQEKNYNAISRQRRKLEPQVEQPEFNFDHLVAASRLNGNVISFGKVDSRQRRKL